MCADSVLNGADDDTEVDDVLSKVWSRKPEAGYNYILGFIYAVTYACRIDNL